MADTGKEFVDPAVDRLAEHDFVRTGALYPLSFAGVTARGLGGLFDDTDVDAVLRRLTALRELAAASAADETRRLSSYLVIWALGKWSISTGLSNAGHSVGTIWAFVPKCWFVPRLGQ